MAPATGRNWGSDPAVWQDRALITGVGDVRVWHDLSGAHSLRELPCGHLPVWCYIAPSVQSSESYPSAIFQPKTQSQKQCPDKSGTALFVKPIPRGQGATTRSHGAPKRTACCRVVQCCAVAHGGPSAPAALILPTAQNAVALVAEPSPVIRQVTEWLQTVSPLARSYILLNTPNDGPARRRGTRDPTGSQGV